MNFIQRYCLAGMFTLHSVVTAEELVIMDFEGPDFGSWNSSGTAFGKAPATGAIEQQMKVDGFMGRGFLSSFHGGDDATGKLISPEFPIAGGYINFLVGGGGYTGETCINLVSNGEVIRSATGKNTQPGGSEDLHWESWDVRDIIGKPVSLEIIDSRKGGWGHISIDQILQSDKPAVIMARHEYVINERYLIWPVSREPAMRVRYFLTLDDQSEPFSFSNIAISDEPDFWTFTDLKNFQGQKLVVSGRIPEALGEAWEMVKLSDTFPGEDIIYQEPERPQYHFTSRRGWLNDPNGLAYQDGKWHLFYQHNPYNHNWDNMHWGHAVSSDLLHWKELPEALYPQAEGFMYSGSAVVAPKERTALAIKGDDALVLAYTAAGGHSYLPGKKFTQAIAVSHDAGETFQKYAGNPVMPHHINENRDPKVFWHAPSGQWVMTLYHDGNEFGIYTSPDLVRWIRTSTYEIPGDAECPDLFQLAIDGDAGNSRWLAWGANGKYLLGDFNGREFKPQGPTLQHYFGNTYAGQTYDNAPAGRRVHIGWMREGGGMPNSPFNLQMSLPMDFSLRRVNDNVRLWIDPIKEIASLRSDSKSWSNLLVDKSNAGPLADFSGRQFEVDAVIATTSEASEIGFKLFDEYPVVWRKSDQSFTGMEGLQAPIDEKLHIRLFVDTCSLEIFVNGSYHGRYISPKTGTKPLAVIAKGGAVHFDSLNIHRLKSVWK